MRALARLLHRWFGLAVAIVLFVSGFTGALLTVARPLDRNLNAVLFASSPEQGAWSASTLDAIAHRMAAEFPEARLVYRLPRTASASLQVHVAGEWHGEIFFDARGAELGRRGERQGFYNLLFELHSSLLTEGAGKTVLFAGACAFCLLLFTGIVAWWPRRLRNGFRIELRRGPRRGVFDLHRVGGAALGLLLLVSVSSGAYMAYRPLSGWLAQLAGSAVQPPPALPSTGALQGEGLPLSQAIERANEALPGGRVSIVDRPAGGDPIRVRKQLADELHPNGLSSVWLHPGTGAVLRVTPWREADLAVQGFEYVYPLHIGELGGNMHRVLVGLAGVALASLAASGPWLWLSRRRIRRPLADPQQQAGC